MIINENGIVYRQESSYINYFIYENGLLKPKDVKLVGYFSEFVKIGELNFDTWVDFILKDKVVLSSDTFIEGEIDTYLKRLTGREDPYLIVPSLSIEDLLKLLFKIIQTLLDEHIKIYSLEWK